MHILTCISVDTGSFLEIRTWETVWYLGPIIFEVLIIALQNFLTTVLHLF